MKYIYGILPLFILAILLFSSKSLAQNGKKDEVRLSPKAEIKQQVGLTDVQILYGRPGVKGRTIWGKLVPYDAVWRAGANEATVFPFQLMLQLKERN